MARSFSAFEDHSQRRRHWHVTDIHGGSWSAVLLRSDPTTSLGHRTDDDVDVEDDD